MRSFLILASSLLIACGDEAGPDGPPPVDDQGPAILLDVTSVDAAPLVDAPIDAAPLDAEPPEPDVITPRLQINPAEIQLEIGDAPPTVTLTLEWMDEDGGIRALPSNQASWMTTPPSLGEVDPETGVFTSSNQPGVIQVDAVVEGELASARIEVIGAAHVLDEGTREDAAERFEEREPREGCQPPELLYPEAGTTFPRKLSGLTFQWRANRHDLFMLKLSAGAITARYYTHRDQFTPASGTWALLQSEAARGIPLELSLVGLGTTDEGTCAAAPVQFNVDSSLLKGAIYYWSTADQGIMRLAVDGTEPEPFLITSPQINCPACHALSRDGTRIAFTRTTFPPFGDLAVSTTNEPTDLLYNPSGIAGYFPSWAPDNSRLVGGANGELVILDPDTGTQLDALINPEAQVSGSPDWSWGGGRIVAASGPRSANLLPNVGIVNGSIFSWSSVDGVWLLPEILAERSDERWLDRPAFSPDDRWVIYNSIGDDTTANRDSSNANIDLWLISSEGGAPIHLDQANQGDLKGNSWPKWAPYDGRGTLWVAFSSLRDYGHLLTSGVTPQIWISAIDPQAAARGEDPSSPAFRLPYQSVGSGNHIPYWSLYEKD